ncbi:MAG TPA: hypothetical protein VF719_09925, partial [Abditibacteriaceae bacterium]
MDEQERINLKSDNDYDAAINEALEEGPRAGELRRMTLLLVERRKRMREDLNLAETPQERESIRKKLVKLSEQIAVLHEEANITE